MWPRDLFLSEDWFKLGELFLFEKRAVCPMKGGLCQFQPILLEKEIFRPAHWVKEFLALRKSQLYFLKCRVHCTRHPAIPFLGFNFVGGNWARRGSFLGLR